MADRDTLQYTQSVHRRIPGFVRVIQALLYVAVLIFTVLGAMYGPVWLIPALGTLFGSWYYMGAARVTYLYRLEGTQLFVQRTSGLKSKQKTEDFGEFDLTTLRAMAPDGMPGLSQTEAEFQSDAAKPITYDVSAHDPDDICSVMYLTGIGQEAGRPLKVYFQPSPGMREAIRQIAPDRVFGYDQ